MMYLHLMVLKSGHPMTECFRSLFGKFVAALNTIYLFCLWGTLKATILHLENWSCSIVISCGQFFFSFLGLNRKLPFG